jgi:hypothetical protein
MEACAKCGRRVKAVVWYGREGAGAPLCKGCARVADAIMDGFLGFEGETLYLALAPEQMESLKRYFGRRSR